MMSRLSHIVRPSGRSSIRGQSDLVGLRAVVATNDSLFAQGHRSDAKTRTFGYCNGPFLNLVDVVPWLGRRVPGSIRWANPGLCAHGTAQHFGSVSDLIDSSIVTRRKRTHEARSIRRESTSVDAVHLVCGARSWMTDSLPGLGQSLVSVRVSVRAPRRHTLEAAS